ncbi:ABC transporter ATP-binding protein [Brevibacillus fulvus]|nr:ABC transporter ATP-binding protein [Brevibacillus fulvus]
MERITKKYGQFTANQEISFALREGEIHAIVGENGAGKTTLMRILYGMEQPTSGTIRIHGAEKRFANPAEAIDSGIGMVHQHFMLFPSRTIAENIVIGNEPRKSIWFDRKQAIAQVGALAERFRLPIAPGQKVGDCPLGTQQRVEILKVLYNGAKIIILDEPTAVLTPLEVKELLITLRGLAEQGKSIILITHKLHEVMEVADRITVLRNGRVTGQLEASQTTVEEVSRLMVGRELDGIRRETQQAGQPLLQVNRLFIRGKKGKPLLDHVSFHVRSGEIVGIAGISGNGQSELVQALTGLLPVDEGTVLLQGKEITNRSVKQIREAGLAHIPEDRYLWGTAKEASVKDNAIMGHHRLKEFQRGGILRQRKLDQLVTGWINSFAIKTSSLANKAQNLSGGNLQKVIVAREIGHATPFLLACEPTRGVDIGAMEFIHQQLMDKRNRGEAVLLVSSELSEIMTLSDRILVMFEGKVVGELNAETATEEQISLLMAGGKQP